MKDFRDLKVWQKGWNYLKMLLGMQRGFPGQQLEELFKEIGFSALVNINQWFHYFAILDAVLTAIALALGTAAGLLIAARNFNNWHSLKVRAGE